MWASCNLSLMHFATKKRKMLCALCPNFTFSRKRWQTQSDNQKNIFRLFSWQLENFVLLFFVGVLLIFTKSLNESSSISPNISLQTGLIVQQRLFSVQKSLLLGILLQTSSWVSKDFIRSVQINFPQCWFSSDLNPVSFLFGWMLWFTTEMGSFRIRWMKIKHQLYCSTQFKTESSRFILLNFAKTLRKIFFLIFSFSSRKTLDRKCLKI